MPFVPSHMRVKAQPAPPPYEVQVTEPNIPQNRQTQNPVVEQTNEVNHEHAEDNSYDFQSEIEDILVSILDEMTVIKKMISQQNRNRDDDDDGDDDGDDNDDDEVIKPTKSKSKSKSKSNPTPVEVEKLLPVQMEQRSNALDFSDCF